MKSSRFSEEQIIGFLRQAGAGVNTPPASAGGVFTFSVDAAAESWLKKVVLDFSTVGEAAAFMVIARCSCQHRTTCQHKSVMRLCRL